MLKFLRSNYLFLIIIGLSVFFRFWQINNLPGGLFPDEAANGLDINSIFKGDIQPFYERGNGREALFFYFLAFSVMLFGRGPWQHHIVSAGFGVAEVIATYFLTKRLFGKRTALIASFLMAVSSYAVTLSRTAFRANTVPLFTTLTFLFLVKFFQTEDTKQKRNSLIYAGISFSLGFYTYISARMMIPLLGLLLLVLLIGYRSQVRNFLKQNYSNIFLGKIAGLITLSPLIWYFIQHPASIVGRAGHVSIFSKDLNNGDILGTFLEVFKLTMFSFFTEGDLNWRHNVSGYPHLTPLVNFFFAIGLLWFTFAILKLLRQMWLQKIEPRTLYQAFVAIWFWFMLAPEVTTAEGIPHGLRLIGIIPALFIIPAYAINRLWVTIASSTHTKSIAYAFATFFFVGVFSYNYYLYFAVAANSPDYYYAFRSDLTTVSNYLNERNNKDQTYLSLDTFSVQTVDYFTTEKNNPYTLLDPARTHEVKLKKGDQVVFTQSTLYDAIDFRKVHPSAILIKTDFNKFGQKIMEVYEQK